MRQSALLKCAVASIFAVLLVAVPARADLRPVAQFFGKISLSVDAEGNNNLAGGTIRVEKPGGATVRAAFLMANSHGVFGNRTISDGDVTLAGTPISWDRTEFNGVPCCPTFFHNVFANVTSIVQPIIDAAPAGVTNLQVTETGTTQVNGTILVVVFDDPNETTDNSVTLLFGGQATGGETFLINLAEPISGALDRAEMGLGIGHGFQGLSGTPMVNIVNVNGTRLTSSAGGEDDGGSFDGGLITVGGIGDSIANPPDPFGPSTGFRTDDELYDLRPFLTAGDTQIEVFSFNPSDDDNILFAYFFTSVPSAVLPDVPPPVAGDLVGILDPSLPTIILTHGLLPEGLPIEDVWTGNGEKQAATLIGNFLGDDVDQVNIVQYIWDEAFQPFDCNILGLSATLPSAEGYLAAQRNVIYAGARLARLLADDLGPGYARGIHFIGHSLGTAVNAHAARGLLDELPDVTRVQFTALDRPHHVMGVRSFGVPVRGICDLTAQQESISGYDANFFASVLPSRPGLDLRLDNYFSLTGAGVGDEANGAFVYNHRPSVDDPNVALPLVEPNDVGGRYFEEENAIVVINNNHSGVQQWYRWTIDPNAEAFTRENLFNGPNCVGFFWERPPFFDPSLDPCDAGWRWALLRFPPLGEFVSFPAFNADTVELSPVAILLPLNQHLFGCTIQPEDPLPEDPITVICGESSSPFAILEVDIPEDAAFVSFEYAFTAIGDGDYAAVLLDGNTIWVMSGDAVLEEGVFVDSGPIPVGDLIGSRTLTIALYGVGEPNAEFQIRNFSTISVSVLQRVEIDIKPNKEPSPVNLKSKNVIPVAIFTTDTFDATTVDPLSVEFGPDGAFEAHGRGHIEDVDGDSDLDLVLHFAVQETGISCGDSSASLTGETFGGEAIEGSDSIKTVGCK